MSETRNEFLTLLQLFCLICLFYWSATWNTPFNFDFNRNPIRKQQRKEDVEVLFPDGFSEDKHTIVLESFKSVKSATYRALKIASSSEEQMLPPFNAWKKEELIKQETDFVEGGRIKKRRRRKLNFASSKCGAKILQWNSEASSTSSILNEKIDEYMLNPCHVKSTWFVIELCDTIEATQVELANYELYSSPPRAFSIYWSDVYPTQSWRPLGTFEAKHERSTQTFNLDEKNLGKFMKVVISSYHGKEHFCLLSVFRVLGYSMIYEFDDSEDNKNDIISQKFTEEEYKTMKNLQLTKEFPKISIHTTAGKRTGALSNKRRLEQCFQCSLSEFSFCLHNTICALFKVIKIKKNNNVCHSRFKFDNKIFLKSNQCSVRKSKENTRKIMHYFLQYVPAAKAVTTSKSNKLTPTLQSVVSTRRIPLENAIKNSIGKSNRNSAKQTEFESAALIQKESVLTKLTHRIKAAEMSLSLINRYLQQLSESYRQQMEDMQIMFNSTIRAISLASEKAAIIDKEQQAAILKLDERVNALDERVECYANGQQNILKQMMELHGFFLILEFIIVSTIFSIFVNTFKRQQAENSRRNSRFSREITKKNKNCIHKIPLKYKL